MSATLANSTIPPLLEVQNLKTHFRVGDDVVAKAVDGVNFSVQAGRTLAIVGESGCGKSQTAFSIIRLLESNGYHPDDGKILFNGSNLLEKSEEEMQNIRGNQISMIFQEPMASLNPLYRVSNQLSEPLIQHQGMSKREARERCIDLLRLVGIPAPESRVDNHPHEMSGGMRQRVMIAMALACKPTLLVADEPTTALDVTTQAQILRLIQDLQKETNMGTILITHDMGVVNQMADDVCIMYAGKVVEFGTRDDIFGNMQHPYTRRLLESIPGGSDLRHKLHTIPGLVPSATSFPEVGCRFAGRCVEALPECTTETPEAVSCSESQAHRAACLLLGRNIDRSEAAKKVARIEKPKEGEILVKIEDLKTHFPVKKGLLQRTINHVKAVDGLNLHIRRGETLALVGESGCGKTTVGQSVLRLIEEAKGKVGFLGRDILSLPRKELKKLRKHMQLVFQDPIGSLSPRMKVNEIIAEGLLVHNPEISLTERKDKVNEVLSLVGLSPEVSNRFPHEFSGGQRQRIALARALILEPEFLILDEPTSALDVSVQAQILNLLEEIQVKRNLAYLFITHDLGVVEYLADRIAVMYLGRIVEQSSCAELFRHPKHPYTRVLLDAVPTISEERKPFAMIDGDVPSPLNPPSGCHFHPRCPIAQESCRQEYPPLKDDDHGFVACHFPHES
jgi:peptide/nickel transport system ATP-binding protein